MKRHRLFETSFPVPQPACNHRIWTPRFPPATNWTNLRKTVEIGAWRVDMDAAYRAMGGLEWMTREELSQALPPAYLHYIAGFAPVR